MRWLKIGPILLAVFLAFPCLSQAATSSSDQYRNPDTVNQAGDILSTAASGTQICAGNFPAIPAGWLIVDFFYNPSINCFPFGSWNVWVIDDLSPKPVGTVLRVCSDYNRVLPSDWRVNGYLQSSTQCGRPVFLTYYNIVEIQRVTGPIVQPPLVQPEGTFDAATCSALQGWAWDRLKPNTPINVDILADGNLVTQVLADQYRSDLQAAGKGDGRHGFSIPMPKSLLDNLNHSIGVRVSNTTFNLTLSPRSTHCANPIDDPRSFIRQQYLDFLNREPDTGGWDFWTGQITGCGADPVCIDYMRIQTSKAFFLSGEFQGTGYVVHRFFKASYGRVPTILEFFADLPAIGAGAQAFANAWVQRTSFKSLFDPLSNGDYVDHLFANAQVTPDSSMRNDLISGLNSGTYSRATALRMVVEYGPFVSHEFNPAFVLMQYFGYLRRNPDPDGYNFWLGQLNQYNDQNNMVKAYITSTEYRMRFGKP